MRGRVSTAIKLAGVLAVLARVHSGWAQTQDEWVRPRIHQAIDDQQRIVLHGNTRRLARPEFDRGAAPPDLQLDHVLLVLTRSTEQQAALDRLLQEQQDKTSPSYRHWLTPQQFGERFGASPDDIAQITGWLESHGFTVDEVPASRGAVEFSGTAGQVQEAFHTAIHRYDVKGQEHWGNAREPEIPQALGGVVSGIANLDSFLPNRSSPGLRRLFRFRRAPAPSLFIVLGGTITLLAPKT